MKKIEHTGYRKHTYVATVEILGMLSLYHYFLISFSVYILGKLRYYEYWDIRKVEILGY